MNLKSQLYTLPNALSILRCFIGPVVAYVIANQSEGSLWLALILMCVAEVTDYLDGALARKLGTESNLGKFIDPVCDSIYHLFVFMSFLSIGWMPAWMVIVIYTRDLAVPYIRSFARQHGQELSVSKAGKIKTALHGAVQVIVVTILLTVPESSSTRDAVVFSLFALATIASLYSLFDYVSEAIAKIRGD